MSVEFTRALQSLVVKAKSGGIPGVSLADLATLAEPTLKALDMQPSPADMAAIGQAFLRYLRVAQEDMQKVGAFDFSPPRLESVAPALPKRSVSWQDLFNAWLQRTGGVLEDSGYGVSRKRHSVYHLAIEEFTACIGDVKPNEVTREEAKLFQQMLQENTKMSVRTKKHRLICIRNLMRIGVEQELIARNPFESLTITTPAGPEDQTGYRALTKQELIKVFTVIKDEPSDFYRLVFYILICTGCRLAEAVQLRTRDIKQTANGVWYFDWRHEPTDECPMLLKTKASNNRMTPMHPRLPEAGLLDLDRSKDGRLFLDASQNTTNVSVKFKKILVSQDIWEKRKTVTHSLRGSARDLWREAGMPQDVRNAMTGHQSKEVGERSYSEGLKPMPDEVYKHLIKVDLSFL